MWHKEKEHMTQLPQSHTVQDLLGFYDRVNPILSKWLAKPIWRAGETAMLCAGFVPNSQTGDENDATNNPQESILDHTPIDSKGCLQPNYEICRGYFHLLAGKEAASPRDMVNTLFPATTLALSDINRRGGGSGTPVLRVMTIDLLREFQWLFIIGNAVGLPVPALLPFDLLNGLRDRLTAQSVPEFSTVQKKERLAEARLVTKEKARPSQQKPRGLQAVRTTAKDRGYHTTEEVAGLTNLLPDTLNKYAREGIYVEGFTPFKRQNGRSWQWRDDSQQADYAARASGPIKADSQQSKSLTALLGPNPFQK